MKKVISTEKAPAAIGPYSQAIEVNGMVYTSGIIPVVPETGEIPEGSVAQAKQALTNLSNLLEAAGTNMDNVVKTTVFIKEMISAPSTMCIRLSLQQISHPEAVWKLHVFRRMLCLKSKQSQSNRKSSSRELHVSDTLELFFYGNKNT